jgi:predicted dehydrogenase
VEGFPDTFKMLFRAVYGAIEAGGEKSPLFATPADGHQEVQVCEAILRSHAARRWVKV